MTRLIRIFSYTVKTNSPTAKRLLQFCFMLAFILYVVAANSSRLIASPWLVGEWLVNYEGGFARRGLAGSAIIAFSDLIGADLLWIVLAIQVLLFGAFLVFLFTKVTSGPVPLGILVALFNPMAVSYFLVDPGGVAGRKEFALFLIAIFWFGFQSENLDSGRIELKQGLQFASFVLGIVALILTHEGLAFFIPLLAVSLLLRPLLGKRLPMVWTLTSLLTLILPVVGSLLFLLLRSSDPSLGKMCHALTSRLAPEKICDGALYYSVKTGMSGIEYASQQTAKIAEDYSFYAVVGVVCLFVSYLALMTFPAIYEDSRKRVHAPLHLAFLVSLSIPVYIIALDWGRYMSITSVLISLGLLYSYRRQESPTTESSRYSSIEWPSPNYKTWLITTLASLWLFFGVRGYAGDYLSIAYSWVAAIYLALR